jgi:menaquinone-9 beta-reductase
VNEPTSVCVLGGGPAGLMASIGLARASVACQLLERSTKADDKVCGEFLSPEAVARLDALKFPWAESQACKVHRICLQSAGRSVSMPLPFEARSVQRSRLDSWLMEHARGLGVKVNQGVHVREVERTAEGFALHAHEQTFLSATLILATGKHALARFHARTAARGPSLVGWKMNFHNLGTSLQAGLHETLGLFFFKGGYGGISLVGTDTLTVSLLVQPSVLQSAATGPLGLIEQEAQRLPLLQQVLKESQPLWARPKTVANLPYGYCAATAEPGVFPVGDQFAVLPSFTGTGISFAMASGELAAKSVAQGASSAAYVASAQKVARQVLRRALPLHNGLQRPVFAGVAMKALAWVPALLPLIAKATRVPQAMSIKGAA